MADNIVKTIKIETFNNFGTVNFVSDKNEINTMTSAQSAVVANVPKCEKIEIADKEVTKEISPKEVKQNNVTVTQDEMSPEQRMISRFSLQPKHIEKLNEWTGKSEFEVVYSNEKNLFTSKEFFAKVRGLENIMILCETSCNMVFGGYFSKMPEKQNTWITDDPDHFVFTLRNPNMVPPTQIKPRPDNKNIFLIKDDNERREICENCAFVVCNDSTSKQHIRFATMYHDSTYKGDRLFAGNQKTFQIRNLVAVQWK